VKGKNVAAVFATSHAAEGSRPKLYPKARTGIIVKRTNGVLPFTSAGEFESLVTVVLSCSG
jgi:hypothetical protein